MAGAPALLIVSGPPGAGKTSVARRLAETSPAPAVHLRFDDFLHAIRSGFVEPWLPQSRAQNAVVTRAFAGAGAVYAGAGYAVVLDGVVGPWFLDIYRDAARAIGADLDYAVLLPERAVAVARARGRDADPLSPYPPRIFDGFADMAQFSAHVLDTTSMSIEAAASIVREGCAAGRFRLR